MKKKKPRVRGETPRGWWWWWWCRLVGGSLFRMHGTLARASIISIHNANVYHIYAIIILLLSINALTTYKVKNKKKE